MRPDIDPMPGELGVLIIVAMAVIIVSWFAHEWLNTRREP
jgi:hypothetical protein